MSMTLTDGQLLETYVDRGDPAAFATLVERHGPTVLRVCRFVLRDPHDAEDAFQATFLVFLRRAPSVQDPERLGKWLCGVAYRVAVRVRTRAADRRWREGRRAAMAAPAWNPEELWEDLGPALREELDRLPEKYRAPLLLCYLEGLTHEEAARHLGWPVGTVKVRLVRARRVLRTRLDRRKLGGALLLLMMLSRRTPAAVPESLANATVEVMQQTTTASLAEREALVSRPRGLIDDVIRDGPGARRWIWVMLAILVLATSITGGMTVAGNRANDNLHAELPANLTNILDMMCR